MESQGIEAARRWLAERGVVETGDGWIDTGRPERPVTTEEIARSWSGEVFTDEDRNPAEQVRLAFGLLDLLDDYGVACAIRSADRGAKGPLPREALWEGYRRRLEASRDAEAVSYSLWTDWFEDHDTAATAFAEVLGNDIDHIVAEPSAARLRRAVRVLSCSGPVPWPVIQRTYDSAARLPALHGPLFKGLLLGYHDVYGNLDRPPRSSSSRDCNSRRTPRTSHSSAPYSPQDMGTATAAPRPETTSYALRRTAHDLRV